MAPSESVEGRLVRIETKVDILLKQQERQLEEKAKEDEELNERLKTLEHQVLAHQIYFKIMYVVLGMTWAVLLPLIVDKVKALFGG